MSQENLAVVERSITAVNERDIDGYLVCCSEDIQLRTPLAAIEGAYEGQAAIRRFFADIQDTAPDFRVDVERLDPVGPDQVLALLRITASGRASGAPAAAATPTANVYDLADGKITRIRIFVNRDEALKAVGLKG